MKFFSLNNKLYELIGWQKKLSANHMYILKTMWDIEQTFHNSQSNRHLNWDMESFWFHLSDKDLMDLTGIKSRSTVSAKVKELVQLGLLETSDERSKNHEGKATEYRIVKPIPLPDIISFPNIYVSRYGQNYLEEIVQELKEMHAQKHQERTIFVPSDEPQNDSYEPSGLDKAIIQMCLRYIPEGAGVVQTMLLNLEDDKKEMVKAVLMKSIEADFQPSSPHMYINSLLTDDNYLQKMGAAALKASGGFTVPERKPAKASKKSKADLGRDDDQYAIFR